MHPNYLDFNTKELTKREIQNHCYTICPHSSLLVAGKSQIFNDHSFPSLA